MPIYEYKCKNCRKVTELIRHVSDCPEKIKCTCGKTAKRVISQRGAVLTDGDVKWLASAKENLPNSAKNIETRGEWKQYLKGRGLECVG
ncbi:MAG: FmdB family zinc ribbon protein [Desulfosalsimonadaceae bacterium]